MDFLSVSLSFINRPRSFDPLRILSAISIPSDPRSEAGQGSTQALPPMALAILKHATWSRA